MLIERLDKLIGKKIFTLIFSLLLFSNPLMPHQVSAQTIDELSFITENYPPYNFEDQGKLQGISVELLVLMFKNLKAKKTIDDIHLKPWARGYNALLKKKNTVLFVVTRSAERENLFKWVGPIAETSVSLIARKDKHIVIRSNVDLLKYKIGAVIDDIGEQLLKKAGVELDRIDRISGVNVIVRSINKLNKGRFDAWAYAENVALWEIKKNGLNPNDYEVVYTLNKGELYYAFHKSTSDLLIEALQDSLDKVKREGTLDMIKAKYENQLDFHW